MGKPYISDGLDRLKILEKIVNHLHITDINLLTKLDTPLHYIVEEGVYEEFAGSLYNKREEKKKIARKYTVIEKYKEYINTPGLLGDTPLMVACKRNKLLMVKILLHFGANPNTLNDKGCSPIIIASWHGYIKIVELLVKTKASLNGKENKYLINNLLRLYQYSSIKLLVKKGWKFSTGDLNILIKQCKGDHKKMKLFFINLKYDLQKNNNREKKE